MKQPTRGRIALRTAGASDAKKLYALIQAHLEEGHLLPRTLDELTVHAERFVIAVKARKIVGCAELAPLSPHVAEVRSLRSTHRRAAARVGVAIVDELPAARPPRRLRRAVRVHARPGAISFTWASRSCRTSG